MGPGATPTPGPTTPATPVTTSPAAASTTGGAATSTTTGLGVVTGTPSERIVDIISSSTNIYETLDRLLDSSDPELIREITGDPLSNPFPHFSGVKSGAAFIQKLDRDCVISLKDSNAVRAATLHIKRFLGIAGIPVEPFLQKTSEWLINQRVSNPSGPISKLGDTEYSNFMSGATGIYQEIVDAFGSSSTATTSTTTPAGATPTPAVQPALPAKSSKLQSAMLKASKTFGTGTKAAVVGASVFAAVQYGAMLGTYQAIGAGILATILSLRNTGAIPLFKQSARKQDEGAIKTGARVVGVVGATYLGLSVGALFGGPVLATAGGALAGIFALRNLFFAPGDTSNKLASVAKVAGVAAYAYTGFTLGAGLGYGWWGAGIGLAVGAGVAIKDFFIK